MARWQNDRLWALVHAERTALAEDLSNLSEEQWRHRTLCGQWDVEQVIAHLTASGSLDQWRWLRSMLGALITRSTLALVMSMAGRETYLDQLDGSGVPTLRSRLEGTAAGTATAQNP